MHDELRDRLSRRISQVLKEELGDNYSLDGDSDPGVTYLYGLSKDHSTKVGVDIRVHAPNFAAPIR